MAVDLDDDLLVRVLKLDAMFDCPLGMTEHELRLMKNQLVGDSYRKKQFVLGSGLSQLLNIAKMSCAEGKRHLLGHILTIIALVAANLQAIAQIVDSGFSQIVIFMIKSASHYCDTILPALQILKSIVHVKPETDLPFPELIRLAQSRSDAVPDVCFEIFSRSAKTQFQNDFQTLISICYSRLPKARDVLPYIKFIGEFLKLQFPWDPKKFPSDLFLDLEEHENETIRLNAIICIIQIPSSQTNNIHCFSYLLSKGFQNLIELISRKNTSHFDECCKALTQLLVTYPAFSSEAQSVTAILLSNITVQSLSTLTILANGSENARSSISAKLGSAFVEFWSSKQNKVHISCASMIRVLSRSRYPVRLKLQKLGIVKVLLKELSIVCSQSADQMSDNDFCTYSFCGDDLEYVVALVSALANFFLGFISMPRINISENHLLLFARLIRSDQNSVRESVCLALKNLCFSACFQRITEVTSIISVADIALLLEDTSEKVLFHSLGLLRNILLPETNKLFEPAFISRLVNQAACFLTSSNPNLVLEAALFLVNIAAGFRDRKVLRVSLMDRLLTLVQVLLLCHIHVIEAVIGLLDHCWSEIRLASVIFFENLFSRACMFKKKRMILEVPIDQLTALDLTRSLINAKEREQSRGNHDTEARCSRAAAGVQTSLQDIRELLQE